MVLLLAVHVRSVVRVSGSEYTGLGLNPTAAIFCPSKGMLLRLIALSHSLHRIALSHFSHRIRLSHASSSYRVHKQIIDPMTLKTGLDTGVLRNCI